MQLDLPVVVQLLVDFLLLLGIGLELDVDDVVA